MGFNLAGDMGFNLYWQRSLQRLRAEVTGFVGGGFCSTCWRHGSQSLLAEVTSKTESRRYRFCRRGYLFSREEKLDSGFYETWKNGLCMDTIFLGFKDDGSREVDRFSVK